MPLVFKIRAPRVISSAALRGVLPLCDYINEGLLFFLLPAACYSTVMPKPSAMAPQRISITTGTILRIIAILITVGVLWIIRDILLYIFIAVLLAALLYPLARWAKAHRIPRALAILVAYLFILGVLTLIFSLLIPAIIDQIRLLGETQGKTWQWVSDSLTSAKGLLLKYGVSAGVQSGVSGVLAQLQDAFTNVFGIITNIFGGIIGLFIVLVLSFYIIAEDSAILHLFRDIIPPSYQEFAANLTHRVIEKLGFWLRGQLFLGTVMGVLYFIGYTLVGIPYALLLAIIGGLLEFVPFVGPFIAGTAAVLLAFTDAPWRALVAFGVIILIQQLENNLLVPRVMKKFVGLNPVVAICAFLIGGKLFGVVGAIFAIPLATAASVAFMEWLAYRREVQK